MRTEYKTPSPTVDSSVIVAMKRVSASRCLATDVSAVHFWLRSGVMSQYYHVLQIHGCLIKKNIHEEVV
jgi:hypothetical protein